jgi:SAM-dependent methyltransferase
MPAGSADLPLPPHALASRVYAVNGGDDPDAAYLELGAQTKRQIVGLLPDGWSFEGKRVLDFGSGAGRTLRHFADEAETAEFWGCDIDAPSIEWMQKSLCPPFHARQTISVPPLALEHGSFDLIYAVSVFTHLTDHSTRWLLERTLTPHGLLSLSLDTLRKNPDGPSAQFLAALPPRYGYVETKRFPASPGGPSPVTSSGTSTAPTEAGESFGAPGLEVVWSPSPTSMCWPPPCASAC